MIKPTDAIILEKSLREIGQDIRSLEVRIKKITHEDAAKEIAVSAGKILELWNSLNAMQKGP